MPADNAATTLWLLTGDCGDYYCEGLHPLAIASSRERAEELKAEAEAATWTNSSGSSGRRWVEVEIDEVLPNELREEARTFAYP